MVEEHPIWLKLFLFHLRDATRPPHWRMMVQEAGFEPAKLSASDLESDPFDRSGTPAALGEVFSY